MTFNNGEPKKPQDYINLGWDITPCKNKKPFIKGWSEKTITLKEWESTYRSYNIGGKLNNKIDVDIDNHFVKRFIEKYLKSCGAIYGRMSNPRSHYLFSGELESKVYAMPNELSNHCKEFKHGNTLLEIRSGAGHQSILPGSIVEGEDVVWDKYAQINDYDGDLEADIAKIALSTALSILYPNKGNRDNYCTAVAGVLANHTDWDENEINFFINILAMLSGDENAHKKMSKGTNAKNPKTKNLGMPKLAEIVGCSVKAIAEVFSWIGVKDSGSSFTGLRCYMIEPKYWQLQYKGKWITFYDTSMLLSYTKIKILILEHCLEEPPEMTPQQWKQVRTGLLQHVEKIETPHEASYYGNIGSVFIHMITNASFKTEKTNLGMFRGGVWFNPEDKHYYFRLENLIETLKRKQLSFEMRKMTHWLREQFEACPTKISVDQKELRVWKVPKDVIEKHELNNTDVKGTVKKIKKRLEQQSYKSPEPF